MSRPHSGKAVGPVQKHHGRSIQAWYYGPDFIALVDDEQLPNFYPSAEAARQAGMRYIDQIDEEEHA